MATSPTIFVGAFQGPPTNIPVDADALGITLNGMGELSAADIIARLNTLKKEERVRPVDIARTLGIPDSRIPAILNDAKGKNLKYDVGRKLIKEYKLEETSEIPPLSHAVVSVLADHVLRKLGLSLAPDDPKLRELVMDFEVFARFVADPEVRSSVEAAEGFLRALRLRQPSPANTPH